MQQQDFDVVIVGTGFSGLCVAIKLKEAGIHNFVILERAADVGGTWRDNHYPGAACDVPSHLYSYSFEPKPDWSRSFGRQQEIQDYIRHCADKFGLRSHIRFNTNVEHAQFDNRKGRWTIRTGGGETLHGRAFVTACGAFSKPTTPDIPGINDFQGALFHTADWDHDFDLRGKRVAVIGTGASAIQVVPAIVDQVAKLNLFQRTAAWVLPKADFPYTEKQIGRFRRSPWVQKLSRERIYWGLEVRVPGFSGDMPGLLKIGERFARAYIKRSVRNPELARKLTPNYGFGCKRVLLSNDYYRALTRENADVITDGIERVEGNTIITRAGQRVEVDAIVCATGFMVTDSLTPFPIVGLNGTDLDSCWQGNPEAYRGTTVHGFPNMFTMTGPNTGLGHTSMVYMIESQTAYVVEGIRHLLDSRAHALDVRKTVQDEFNRDLQRRLDKTVWATGGCSSWYKTESGKIAALWPGHTYEFRKLTAHFDPVSYDRVSPELTGKETVRTEQRAALATP